MSFKIVLPFLFEPLLLMPCFYHCITSYFRSINSWMCGLLLAFIFVRCCAFSVRHYYLSINQRWSCTSFSSVKKGKNGEENGTDVIFMRFFYYICARQKQYVRIGVLASWQQSLQESCKQADNCSMEIASRRVNAPANRQTIVFARTQRGE